MSAEICLSMLRCYQLIVTGFILVPARAVRLAVVCSRHCIARTVVLVEGWLQARWERRLGLQVPEVLIEAGANIVEKAESV
jgi:hypothetical protein